jgi:hypothetical protein
MSLDLSGPTLTFLSTLGVAAVFLAWYLSAFVVVLLVVGGSRGLAVIISSWLRCMNDYRDRSQKLHD